MAVGAGTLRGTSRSVTLRGVIGLLGLLAGLVLLPSSVQASPTLTIAEAEAQLQVLQSQQDQAVEAYNQGQIALTAAQQAADTAKTNVERQQRQVDQAEGQLAGLARVAYMTGGVDPVTGLLSGQGADSVVDRIGSLDQIARVRSSQAIDVKSQQTALQALQITNKQKLDAAAAASASLDNSRKQVQSLIDKQNGVINNLQAEARQALLAQQAAERAAAAQQAAEAAARAAAAVQQAAAAAAARERPPVTSGPAGASQPIPPGTTGLAQTVLAAAMSQLGKPYLYAAAGPNAYDCSGLTMWAFAHAGISLPHSSQMQFNIGRPVSRSDLQPGDLVFYNEGGTIGHVGIYVGDGNMVDANHTGGWVGVRPLYDGFAGGRRL